MHCDDRCEATTLARRYERFAEIEAAGRSPVYEAIARQVAGDPAMLAFLASFPPAKQQPNLFLGAVQFLRRRPTTDWDTFRHTVEERGDEIAAVMLARSTQTNVPARCATLLPALATLDPPLALLEVGASAGLCLYPDQYTYDYQGRTVAPASQPVALVTLSCTASPGTPLPTHALDVVWRAGLDLDPLDLNDAEDRAWLEALVWPGEEHLGRQLRAAADVLEADPPLLRCGDLVTDLSDLLSEAPAGATAVVFHSAVLAYVPDRIDRERFAEVVRGSSATWLANEHPRSIPGLPASSWRDHPDEAFLLCRDGEPLARTDPHGAWVQWHSDW